MNREPVSIHANMEQDDTPLALGRHDLAGALARSVNDWEVLNGGKSFSLRITYRDAHGKQYESSCEIRVSELFNVQTIFTGSRELPHAKRFWRTKKLKPNIVLVGHNATRLEVDERFTYFENREGDASGLVIKLRNEPTRGWFGRTREPLAVRKVQARILYFNSNGIQCCNVAHGTWLKERYSYTHFPVGAERILLVGLLEEDRNQHVQAVAAPEWHVVRYMGITAIDDMREDLPNWNDPPRQTTIGDRTMRAQVRLFTEQGIIGRDLEFAITFAENGMYNFRPTQS